MISRANFSSIHSPRAVIERNSEKDVGVLWNRSFRRMKREHSEEDDAWSSCELHRFPFVAPFPLERNVTSNRKPLTRVSALKMHESQKP